MGEPIALAVFVAVCLMFLFLIWHICRLQDKINRLDSKLAEHLHHDKDYKHVDGMISDSNNYKRWKWLVYVANYGAS